MRRLTKVVVASLFLVFAVNAANAQDFTDQDMKDYAVILLAQKAITEKISPYVNDLIEKQDGIDGNRYAELDAAAKGDVAKLPGDATDFEKQFYEMIQKRVKARTKGASTVVSTLAKYSLGAKKYNAIKKAYKSDSNVKAKVDGMMAELAVTEEP